MSNISESWKVGQVEAVSQRKLAKCMSSNGCLQGQFAQSQHRCSKATECDLSVAWLQTCKLEKNSKIKFTSIILTTWKNTMACIGRYSTLNRTYYQAAIAGFFILVCYHHCRWSHPCHCNTLEDPETWLKERTPGCSSTNGYQAFKLLWCLTELNWIDKWMMVADVLMLSRASAGYW